MARPTSQHAGQVCRHGKPLSPPSSNAALECRDCLPDGATVDAFVALMPNGADVEIVAAMLGCSRQAVHQAEARMAARLRKLLAGRR